MTYDRLPKWEYNLYLFLSLGVHLYSFYAVYLSSRQYEDQLDQEVGLESNSLFWGLKKDSTDFEWSFWMDWARSWLLWLMLGHVGVSQLARIVWGKHRWRLLAVYGMVACWLVLGTKGLAAIFLKTLIYYMVAQVKSPLLIWSSCACMLLMVHSEGVEDTQLGGHVAENKHYLLQFTLTVRSLFYISFCLEYRGHQAADSSRFSFVSMLTYIFYYPVFHNGPVIPFNEFSQQMQRSDTRTNLKFSILLADVLRLLLWWCLAELMVCMMYMHATYSHHPVLQDVSYWALGGLALAQVLFFYIKYLVLYGFPALILQLDGLDPPALPRCVSTMHSFSGIWRSFDVGLYRFLMRYIYIPMGGSHRGMVATLMSTALTFVFVCCWHGGHAYLWYWAAINWIGLVTEHGVKMFLSAPSVQERVSQHLSLRTRRQLHAALASVSTAFLIFTNLVFLGGEHVGKIYWHRMFIHGWPWVPLVVFCCLYCFAQVGIEWSVFLFPEYKWKFPLCRRRKAEPRA